jgi:hypothetical protein
MTSLTTNFHKEQVLLVQHTLPKTSIVSCQHLAGDPLLLDSEISTVKKLFRVRVSEATERATTS